MYIPETESNQEITTLATSSIRNWIQRSFGWWSDIQRERRHCHKGSKINTGLHRGVEVIPSQPLATIQPDLWSWQWNNSRKWLARNHSLKPLSIISSCWKCCPASIPWVWPSEVPPEGSSLAFWSMRQRRLGSLDHLPHHLHILVSTGFHILAQLQKSITRSGRLDTRWYRSPGATNREHHLLPPLHHHHSPFFFFFLPPLSSPLLLISHSSFSCFVVQCIIKYYNSD